MATEVGTLVLRFDTREVELGTTDLKSAERAAANLEKQTKKLGGQVIDARSKFRAMRGSTAQLGMQLQDVAVQAQMGTNALVILGQQGSQVASLFGPGGALLGAAIAITAAVANMAFGFGRASEEASDLDGTLRKLNIAFSDLTREERAYLRVETIKNLERLREEAEGVEKELNKLTVVTPALARAYSNNTVELQDNSEKADELRGKLALLNREIKQNEEILNGNTSAYKEVVAALQEEIETIGLSDKALALRQAALDGMSVVQRRHIAELYDLLEARKENIEFAEKQAEAELAVQDMFNQMLNKRLEAQRAAAAEEERIEKIKNQRLLEASDMLLSNQSDRKKEAARVALALADEEKRENAKTIISDSYTAAMKAYKSLSGIPVIGPALGAAAAGAIIAAGVSYAGKSLSGRALGGQVRPGESYVVGERGPELLTMGNAGGRIATNESMKGGASLVYSPTVNISGGATEQDRAIFTAQLRQQKAEIADLLARRRF